MSILSIHRSKGLEKPVVLVCGLTRRINRDNVMTPVLFHPELGVGPRGLDRQRMVEYPTLARRAVARQVDRELLAEERRPCPSGPTPWPGWGKACLSRP